MISRGVHNLGHSLFMVGWTKKTKNSVSRPWLAFLFLRRGCSTLLLPFPDRRWRGMCRGGVRGSGAALASEHPPADGVSTCSLVHSFFGLCEPERSWNSPVPWLCIPQPWLGPVAPLQQNPGMPPPCAGASEQHLARFLAFETCLRGLCLVLCYSIRRTAPLRVIYSAYIPPWG